MFNKGIWYKEWLLVRFVVIFCWITTITVSIAAQENGSISYIANKYASLENYEFESILGLIVIFSFIMAVLQIGAQRKKGNLISTLNLPGQRKHIYLIKWLLGCSMIVVGSILALLAGLINRLTYGTTGSLILLDFLGAIATLILISLACYSFTLMIGSITGSSVSQIILSLSGILILNIPTTLERTFHNLRLIRFEDTIHSWTKELLHSAGLYSNTIKFSPFDLFLPYDQLYFINYLTPIITIALLGSIVLFVWLGTIGFNTTRIERNGKIMSIPKLNFIVVLLASYLTAIYASEIAYYYVDHRFTNTIIIVIGIVSSSLYFSKWLKRRDLFRGQKVIN